MRFLSSATDTQNKNCRVHKSIATSKIITVIVLKNETVWFYDSEMHLNDAHEKANNAV